MGEPELINNGLLLRIKTCSRRKYFFKRVEIFCRMFE